VPGWPDEFFDLLEPMIATGTPFNGSEARGGTSFWRSFHDERRINNCPTDRSDRINPDNDEVKKLPTEVVKLQKLPSDPKAMN
jgi:hypothetical protein